MLPTLLIDAALPLLAFIVLTRYGIPMLYARPRAGGRQWKPFKLESSQQ